ncbi:MAG: Trm112 family protein [Elusimicrobiota bacterium]
MPLDPELLKILACPVCKRPLEHVKGAAEALDCKACGKRYPVKDGIPVLLVEEAVSISPRR